MTQIRLIMCLFLLGALCSSRSTATLRRSHSSQRRHLDRRREESHRCKPSRSKTASLSPSAPTVRALKLRGPNTRVIDLKGRFVVPGFNDNHVHFASAAQFLEFNIMRASTQEQFVARVKEVISRLPKGEWIVGGFWGAYDEWAAGSAGTRRREPFAPDMSLVNDITLIIRCSFASLTTASSPRIRPRFARSKLDLNNPQAPTSSFSRQPGPLQRPHARQRRHASLQRRHPAHLLARASHAANKECAR